MVIAEINPVFTGLRSNFTFFFEEKAFEISSLFPLNKHVICRRKILLEIFFFKTEVVSFSGENFGASQGGI